MESSGVPATEVDHQATSDESAPDSLVEPADGRATVRTVFVVLIYQGYASALLGVAAPFIAQGFSLDQSGIARMYAWISINSLGALALSRLADRLGRRQILLFGLVATGLSSLGAALATRTTWFICCEIVAYAAIGSVITSSIVMLAEALPTAERARGQGAANLAIGIGGGICVVLAPLFVHFAISWRWLFAVPAVGALPVPVMLRMIPESRRWQLAAESGATAASHLFDVFRSIYARRAIPLVIATLVGQVADIAVWTWIYFHAVTVIHLSPARGSMVLLGGGTLSVAGLELGIRMAERIGRVRTVTILSFGVMLGILTYYWGPPANFAWPTVWLLAAYTCFATSARGAIVAANAAITELFPTALRGTIMGWILFCIALAAIGAQTSIAVLAKPLGGLSNVVGWLGLLTIPSVLVWFLFVDETRGISLEAAAGEVPATSV